jgi:hypothetical protein
MFLKKFNHVIFKKLKILFIFLLFINILKKLIFTCCEREIIYKCVLYKI